MNLFDKLTRRLSTSAANLLAQPDDAIAGFGAPTGTGVPAGIGNMGGAKDVERSIRTHTGKLPQDFVEPVQVTQQQRQIIAMAASVLLRYPDADFLERLDIVDAQLPELPDIIAEDFRSFTGWARETGPRAAEEIYVETFDQRRRCSLFLSYYAVGDTRQRGMAILSFSQQLEALGFDVGSEELPDHLCVVLEALAFSEGEAHERAVEMLASYRDGIEVLRAALSQMGSPYTSVVVAVCRSLPQVDPSIAQKYVDLIRTGPPAEMVGIADLPFPTSQPDHI